MSTHITSTTQWFRCISPAAMPAERHAALAQLVRMLAGDATHRPPPPVSLPGRCAMPTATPVKPAPTPVGSPRRHYSTIGNPEPGDEQIGDWPRFKLEAMDRRFIARLRQVRGSTQAEFQLAAVVRHKPDRIIPGIEAAPITAKGAAPVAGQQDRCAPQ
jgi:hypothetical protein